MAENVFQSTGTTISIGTTAATSVGDTFTEIGGVTNIGDLTRAWGSNSVKFLKTGNEVKFKTSRDDGSPTIAYAYDPADAGQIALEAAFTAAGDYNFKMANTVLAETIYFKAKVMSFKRGVGGPENPFMGESVLAIKSGTLEVA